ncbi:MAG: YitT family protein [Anaerofustis sp.]
MNKSEQIKRYLFFVLGLMVLAFGVALSVKANLGTSPISSLPYVLSLAFPLTIGQFTILMHIVFILLQIALLRKDFDWIQLMQLPAAILFGVFTDAAMRLLSWYAPSSYAEQWICVLLSCVIVAVGVSMEVIANVVMLAGEGMVKAIAQVSGKEFGKIKIVFDSSLVLIAAGCSLLSLHHIAGVREGTLAAALTVGMMSRLFIRKMRPFEKKILRAEPSPK